MKSDQKKGPPTYDFSPEDDLGHIIRYVSIEKRNDYDFLEQHRHNYYEVFLFNKGGGTHLIDFVEYHVTNRSVHLVRPGQVHLLKRMPESYGAVLHISREIAVLLEDVYDLLETTKTAMDHSDDGFNNIILILGLLKGELEAGGAATDAMSACLKLLLLKCFAGARADSGIEMKKSPPQIIAFRKLIECNYRTGRLPAWYAAQLHTTEKRLNELSKETFGTTISNYITDRRMLEAKRLLANSGGSIKEIGYFLGFDDPAYFTRFFKKNAGLTAGDFRKLHQLPSGS